MKPIDAIVNARLQYIFNLKLFEYATKDQIDVEKFDSKIEFESDGSIFSLKENMFGSEGIINAAANNVLLSLGTLFITVDTYLSDLGFSNDPNNMTELGMYRSLMYMLRSAFAHNMLMPKWNVQGPYAKLKFDIDLGHSKITGDLSELDGKIFNEKDIGGHRNILSLINLGTLLISKADSA